MSERMVVLVHARPSVFLYEVERETAQRLYGKRLGNGYYVAFVDKGDVIRWDATERDADRARSVIAECDQRCRAAYEARDKALDGLRNKRPAGATRPDRGAGAP